MKILIILLLTVVIIGCGGYHNVFMLGPAAPPRPADEKIVLTTGELKKSCREIALINAKFSAGQNWTDKTEYLNEELRKGAREAGANAVIRISYNLTPVPFTAFTPSASGTAVLCNNSD